MLQLEFRLNNRPGILAGEHAERPRVRVDHGGADDGLPRQPARLRKFRADSAECRTGTTRGGKALFKGLC